MSDRETKQRQPSRFAYPLIIGGILAVGLVFVFISTASGGQYALEVGQVATSPERYDGKRVRLVGHIKAGSTQELVTAGQPELHFAIIDEQGHEVAVVYQQSRPDAYEEGRSCIVEGTLTDFFRHVQEHPDLTLPDTPEGREQYLALAREHLERLAMLKAAYA